MLLQQRHLLLQKRDGTFYLLLWQEVGRAANEDNGYAGPRSITLSLNHERFSSLKIYEPTFATDVSSPKPDASIIHSINSNRTNITVPDHLAVIEIETM